MYTFLMVFHVFASIVLILVILMQAGRGGGMSEIFGGSSPKTIFGTSAAKFFTKATAACAIVFIITSLSLAVLSSRRSKSLMESGVVQSGKMEEAEPQELDMPIKDETEPAEPQSE